MNLKFFVYKYRQLKHWYKWRYVYKVKQLFYNLNFYDKDNGTLVDEIQLQGVDMDLMREVLRLEEGEVIDGCYNIDERMYERLKAYMPREPKCRFEESEVQFDITAEYEGWGEN
ncbi:hypothetical protein JD969_06015 [Planctomycetota bacterium]|nr:hypothetical protein JD969_06015 [Planctomycetota bacterium]